MEKIIKFKKYVIYTLTAGLVAASLVAVFSVLIGSFNNTTARVLWTLFSVVGHSLLSIILISREEKSSSKFELTRNVIYCLIPVSLLSSIFGIWHVFSGGLVQALYQTYLVVILVSLHANCLRLFRNATKLIDRLVRTNVIATILTGSMVLPILFVDNPKDTLGDFYYRLLASIGIINGTLTVLILIFFKLFLQHHPEARKNIRLFENKGKVSVWVWVLVILIALQLFPFLIFSIIGIFANN